VGQFRLRMCSWKRAGRGATAYTWNTDSGCACAKTCGRHTSKPSLTFARQLAKRIRGAVGREFILALRKGCELFGGDTGELVRFDSTDQGAELQGRNSAKRHSKSMLAEIEHKVSTYRTSWTTRACPGGGKPPHIGPGAGLSADKRSVEPKTLRATQGATKKPPGRSWQSLGPDMLKTKQQAGSQGIR